MDLPTRSYNRLRYGIGPDHSDSSSPAPRELTLSSWPRRPTRNVAKGGDGSIQRAHLPLRGWRSWRRVRWGQAWHALAEYRLGPRESSARSGDMTDGQPEPRTDRVWF